MMPPRVMRATSFMPIAGGMFFGGTARIEIPMRDGVLAPSDLAQTIYELTRIIVAAADLGDTKGPRYREFSDRLFSLFMGEESK